MKRILLFLLLTLPLLGGCATPRIMSSQRGEMDFGENELQHFAKSVEFLQAYVRSLDDKKAEASDFRAMAQTEAKYLSADPFLRVSAPVLNLHLIIAVCDNDNPLAQEFASDLLDAIAEQRFGFVARGTIPAFEEVQTVKTPKHFPKQAMDAKADKWAIRIIERYRIIVKNPEKRDQEDSLLLWFFREYAKVRALKGQLPLLGYGSLVMEVICDQALAENRVSWPDWRVFGPLPRKNRAAYQNQYTNGALENAFCVGLILGDELLLRKALNTLEYLPAPSPALRLVADLARYLVDGEVTTFLRSRLPILSHLNS
jgi:hypothetical protein